MSADVTDTLTLALYQCVPLPLDVAGNLQRLERAAQNAAQLGAQVLVCPEMFITGYAIGPAAVQALAQPCDGGYAQQVAAMAQRHGVAVVYGYPERGADGQVYNAAQWISAQGQRCLNYRKTHLFGELDRVQFAAGVLTSALVEVQGWRVGLLICYDVEFPENTRRLAQAGADVVLVPTANMQAYDFVPQSVVPVRAFENQMAVAYANYCGTEGDVTYGGLSTVAGPDGAVLAIAQRGEQLLTFTLQQQHLAAIRKVHTHLSESVRRT